MPAGPMQASCASADYFEPPVCIERRIGNDLPRLGAFCAQVAVFIALVCTSQFLTTRVHPRKTSEWIDLDPLKRRQNQTCE